MKINHLVWTESMDFNLKRKLNGKWLNETNLVIYLGITIDSKLNWKSHIDDITLQLIRASAMLYKVRDFVNAGFKSNLSCPIWVTYSLCMHYMCTECMHNQSSFHTSKESIKFDTL